MDRLTYRNKNGDVGLVGEKESLTSIEVVDLINNALDKLAHYEELEDDGMLIKLPCAVGDTVWTYWIDEHKETGIETYKPMNEKDCIIVKDLWGKEFFATEEDVEARLKELKELEGGKE